MTVVTRHGRSMTADDDRRALPDPHDRHHIRKLSGKSKNLIEPLNKSPQPQHSPIENLPLMVTAHVIL
jgi:RNase adaptor protein for sRNA GlmZ degradation